MLKIEMPFSWSWFHGVGVMRFPLILRALLLVPLLAAAADQVRATVVCGGSGQTCLETAGSGSLGAVGLIVLAAYALGIAALVVRLAVGRSGLAPRWLIGAAGLAAVVGGQALLAAMLGDGGALGAGWLELLAICAAAGGVVALVIPAVPAAIALVRSLRPSAPRLRPAPILLQALAAPLSGQTAAPLATAAAGRAPPLTLT
jgi:hypothetical protein